MSTQANRFVKSSVGASHSFHRLRLQPMGATATLIFGLEAPPLPHDRLRQKTKIDERKQPGRNLWIKTPILYATAAKFK